MKRIVIDGKEYTIEYSIEATLYDECTEKMMDLMLNAGIAQAEASQDNIEAKERVTVMANAFKNNIKDIPQRTLTLFYAGLLEHHKEEIRSKEDAKTLLVTYIKENNGKSLYDILNDLIAEMGKDHFFEMIGVDKVTEELNNAMKPKKPQDHKKKGGDN